MTLPTVLGAVVGLLGLAGVGVLIGRTRAGQPIVYGGSLLACAVVAAIAIAHLLGAPEPATMTLPLGLPWLGAHFRLDALSAFFLIVITFGGAAASSTRSAIARTRKPPNACCPSIPRFSPA